MSIYWGLPVSQAPYRTPPSKYHYIHRRSYLFRRCSVVSSPYCSLCGRLQRKLHPSTKRSTAPTPIFESYTACHAGDYSQCCAVNTDCCAGGCCPGGSYCVGQGTSNEKCCAGSDSTDCGLVSAPSHLFISIMVISRKAGIEARHR